MTGRLTREDAPRWTWRLCMCADMAKGGYLRQYVCVEEPRLQRTISAKSRTAKPEVAITVDGQPCASLEEALGRLAGTAAPQGGPR